MSGLNMSIVTVLIDYPDGLPDRGFTNEQNRRIKKSAGRAAVKLVTANSARDPQRRVFDISVLQVHATDLGPGTMVRVLVIHDGEPLESNLGEFI